MKPIEAFLADIHPEILQRGSTLVNGEVIEFGRPNKHALRRLIREHYASGQEALHSFSKWLVGVHARTKKQAAQVTATVWNVLCMTYDAEAKQSYPMRLLDRKDETYSYNSKMAISHALRFWSLYTKDSHLYEQLILWMKKKGGSTPQYVLDQLDRAPPYTKAEYRRMLKALEEYKGAPRYPWAWSCLRLSFVWGVPITEIVHLERTRIRQALREGAILLRVGIGLSRRTIQVEHIREELSILDAFPYEWGIVADLVDPARTMSTHLRTTTGPLNRVVKLVFQRAKVAYTSNWSARMRWTAAWLYYKKTKSVVGAQQILGRISTHSVLTFIEELKKREAEMKQSSPDESEETGEYEDGDT